MQDRNDEDLCHHTLVATEGWMGGTKQRICSTGTLSLRRWWKLLSIEKTCVFRIWNLRIRSTVFFKLCGHNQNIQSSQSRMLKLMPESAIFLFLLASSSTLSLTAKPYALLSMELVIILFVLESLIIQSGMATRKWMLQNEVNRGAAAQWKSPLCFFIFCFSKVSERKILK